MRLPGRLGRQTLGDVLGVLHRGRASGVLRLEEKSGRGSHCIEFDGGLVVDVVSALEVPRLGEILSREGFLSPAAHLRLETLLAGGGRTGDLLTARLGISPGLVEAALRQQLRERLEGLFSLRDARLTFHVPRPRSDGAARYLTPREFLHGRPRGRDRAPEGGTPPQAAGARRDPARARALAVLGLPQEAALADVQRAFRQLARECHPDLHVSASAERRRELLLRFSALSQAYHTLVA